MVFRSRIEVIFELSIIFLSICLLRLHFTYHYAADKTFELYLVDILVLIVWLGFIGFVMHWHLDLHVIWSTWPLVSWKYIGVMVKSFINIFNMIPMFVFSKLLACWLYEDLLAHWLNSWYELLQYIGAWLNIWYWSQFVSLV